MNDSSYLERNDTGILSLADLFRHDRLPCRAEPKRWLPKSPTPATGDRKSRPAPATVPQPRA